MRLKRLNEKKILTYSARNLAEPHEFVKDKKQVKIPPQNLVFLFHPQNDGTY
jgi:hypothetical protein